MLTGIYLHLPFCVSRCTYCDFSTVPYDAQAQERYLTTLEQEIRRWPEQPYSDRPTVIDTVFFGGGTPSLAPASGIASLLALLREKFRWQFGAEVTLEMNPSSADAGRAAGYLAAGVNRISLGFQSFSDDELAAIGRAHRAREAVEALRLLRQVGFDNISLDLILGLPGQTLERWRRSLQWAATLEPEHISIYILEVHHSTALYQELAARRANLPGEEMIEEGYLEMIAQLEQFGYRQYEISNFARPGRESRHNLKYWSDQPYLGFGMSAHSYLHPYRFSNVRKLADYERGIWSEGHARAEVRELGEREHVEEALFLGLRRTGGIAVEDFQRRFGLNILEQYAVRLEKYRGAGLLDWNPQRLRLTERGFLLSNEIFQEFLS
ncbi:MAG: radical SAM family heme chaperone HemW [Acidobacteriota bacterium]